MEKMATLENTIDKSASELLLNIGEKLNLIKEKAFKLSASIATEEISKDISNIGMEAFKESQNFLNVYNKTLTLSDRDLIILDKIHTLKNNFSAIVTACELLESIESREDVIELINTSITAAYINLDKINKFDSVEVDVDLNKEVDNLLSLFKARALNKKVEVNNLIENLSVKTDSFTLTSVLENLITNAIKFSKQNGVINIWSEKNGNKIKIYVRDQGIGIPKDRLNNFFDKLGSTSEGTKGETGTGIGMYTSKKLIEKIGGDIEVESEEGKGSTFIVTLPA